MRFGGTGLVAVLSGLLLACGGGSGSDPEGGSGGRAGGGTTGSGSGGRAGDGTGGTAGPTTDARSFCVNELSLLCELFFRCIPVAERTADDTDVFGASVAECKNTKVPLLCSNSAQDCPRYNPTSGSACVATLATYSCDDLAIYGEPTECARACDVGTPGTGGMSGTGGMPGSGGTSGSGGSGTGGMTGSGGRGTGGMTGSGGRGTGGMTGSGGRGTGGADGQLPLCPADYETNRNCPTAGVSCRLVCASGLCGCTCQQLGDQKVWSCVIL